MSLNIAPTPLICHARCQQRAFFADKPLVGRQTSPRKRQSAPPSPHGNEEMGSSTGKDAISRIKCLILVGCYDFRPVIFVTKRILLALNRVLVTLAYVIETLERVWERLYCLRVTR